MAEPLLRTVIDAATLQARVVELGARIADDYRGRPLTVVAVLKGAFVFCADLVRAIPLPLTVDFLGLSSYGSATESSGVVRLTSDLSRSIEGRDVLVVEDIVDTGLTVAYLLEALAARRPASLAVCALLVKPSRAVRPVEVKYAGFALDDTFVVGYGLDHDERWRNLPHIATPVEADI